MLTDGQTDGWVRRTDGWTDGRRTDGWTDGRMDGQTDDGRFTMTIIAPSDSWF